MGNLPDVHDVGVSVAQRAADFLQPTQQHILSGAHAEKFGTAQPKDPVAHPDQRAEFRQLQRLAEVFRQDLLEPDHDPGMTDAWHSRRSGRWRLSGR